MVASGVVPLATRVNLLRARARDQWPARRRVIRRCSRANSQRAFDGNRFARSATPTTRGEVMMMRMLVRLAILGLAGYGAKRLYDDYFGSSHVADNTGRAIV